MTTRDDLLDEYGRATAAPLGTLADLRRKLDAYRAEVLEEKAEEVFEDSRQRYSRVIAIHGADKAALWFTGREDAAKLIASHTDPAPVCDCGTPIPADQRRAYCSDRCRWDDQDHGSDDGGGEA